MAIFEYLRPVAASILHQMDQGRSLQDAIDLVASEPRYSGLSSTELGQAGREAKANLRLTEQARRNPELLLGRGSRGQVAFGKTFGVRVIVIVEDALGRQRYQTVTVNATGRDTANTVIDMALQYVESLGAQYGVGTRGGALTVVGTLAQVIVGGFDAPTIQR